VVPTFQKHWDLKAGDSVLDVGCAKGFMMHDMARLIPGLVVKGVDVSDYAIANAMEDMREHVQVADAVALPFPDTSFDVVISINTIHNLAREECAQALKEIQRVARRGAFVTVDAYRDEEERRRMEAWNLTAKTIMHVDEWKAFFDRCGYTGDYFWFIP
jgi:ubiquinone/menaquinone biosynthesis C-methylase UbiE